MNTTVNRDHSQNNWYSGRPQAAIPHSAALETRLHNRHRNARTPKRGPRHSQVPKSSHTSHPKPSVHNEKVPTPKAHPQPTASHIHLCLPSIHPCRVANQKQHRLDTTLLRKQDDLPRPHRVKEHRKKHEC